MLLPIVIVNVLSIFPPGSVRREWCNFCSLKWGVKLPGDFGRLNHGNSIGVGGVDG